MAQAPYVVVGGGLAAAKAAEGLREEGFTGDVVVVTDEDHLPYERPPLSKDYLRGEVGRDTVFPLAESWYAEHEVEVRTGRTVTALDTDAHRLTLADGGALDYSRLLLATGSSPRVPSVPGVDLDGVHVLRTLDQSDHLATTLAAVASDGSGRLAVVGDGWIGLEVAASARSTGLDVTLIGRHAHPLERVLGPEMGEFYGLLHASHGVHLHRHAEVVAITGSDGRAAGVEMADGTHVAADAVLVAVGAAPRTGLGDAAGLTVETGTGGLHTDQQLRTSAPDVLAAGDVASVPSPRYGRPLRIEHWATALHQGTFAARSMLDALDPGEVYDQLPYFFSDQYDVGMEYLGFVDGPDGYDELVVSGSVEQRELVAFWLLGGRVQAVMAVNTWDRMDRATELIGRNRPVDRAELEAFRD
ncbi:NAD(P)/FAD-dependent oxidoreductase [Oerskovia flava]|uniref:NAD(P)/FAD-dependent oxidoreductase n=1 Tax=Oerskovia flava TaxID=2986422 RepID=UPI0022401A88|nr:FAD/NAD(P)-binding oxidoreductase [Oerskovia sp. JB1-3-2]